MDSMNDMKRQASLASAAIPKLREMAATTLLSDLGGLLFKINHYESGRIAEAMIQLLPDSRFNILTALIRNNETDEIVQMFMSTLVMQIAQKLYIDLEEPEQFMNGIRSLFLLINCEDLRRKGHLEYLWPNDLFSPTPSNVGFTKLTDTGNEVAYKELLEAYQGKSVQ